jgi:hypothetical protein
MARCMLAREEVARGPMGRVLADFLVEHLPFEESADAGMETLRLVLRHGLAGAATQAELWSKARRAPHYCLGFLEFLPDALPLATPLRPDAANIVPALRQLEGNPFAAQLARCLSESGQSFLTAAGEALAKPATHRIVYHLFDLLGGYFAAVRPREGPAAHVEQIAVDADSLAGLDRAQRAHVEQLLACAPDFMAQVKAMLFLSRITQQAAEPVLTRTTAVGPLMRRKLEPVIAPIAARLDVLRETAHA